MFSDVLERGEVRRRPEQIGAHRAMRLLHEADEIAGDLQRVGREMVVERREEDGAEDGNAERGRKLLCRFKDTGGRSDLVHVDAVEHESEELGEAGASAGTGER